jgi:TonB-dependent SusC/RagA subfamily outer membrane receptor
MKDHSTSKKAFFKKSPASRLSILLNTLCTIAILYSTTLLTSAATFTQTITLRAQSIDLIQALRLVEQQTDYVFFYKSDDLKNIKVDNLNIKNNKIQPVLDQLLSNLDLHYKIEGMTIAVSKTNSKRNNTAAEVIQTSINGVVTDPSGTPISGASITIKGTSRGTSSDDNGTFSIEAHISDIVLISSVGYQSREITITNVNSLTSIILSPQPEELEELIVVGYSTQKKESLTGSLNAIDGEDLRNVTTPNVQNMLNGKAPGVFLAPGSGKPGTPGTVVIRGQATLSGTTNPLWVIDGVIVGSSPGDLNPDDVETLTVLKDAASTAAYGSQGANGVIVVTTKAPRAGEMKINYSTRLGFNDLTNGNLQVMNGAELYDYYSSFANADVISFPRWNDDLRESNFDWWDIATRNGFNQNHNLSLQGGTDKLRSYLSLGYYNEA